MGVLSLHEEEICGESKDWKHRWGLTEKGSPVSSPLRVRMLHIGRKDRCRDKKPWWSRWLAVEPDWKAQSGSPILLPLLSEHAFVDCSFAKIKPHMSVLVYLRCNNKMDRSLKQQQCVFSQFWGLEVQDGGASGGGLWWYLSSWLGDRCLLAVSSQSLSSLHTYP